MYADGIKCTHNGTGGTGTITLASITGFPQPTSVFGSSGTLQVLYTIAEYTDSTLATLSKMESGIGSLVLSTNVLTRTVVLKTWSSSTYTKVSATAVSFGNTAANVVITFGGAANTQAAQMTSTFNVTSASSDIWTPFNTRNTYDASVGTFSLVNGTKVYMPVEYIYSKPITAVAVDITTAQASSNLRIGIYDVDTSTGGPANLLTEFTASSQITTTGTGFRSLTLGTPFWLPSGMYWMCIQGDTSGVVVRRLTHQGNGLISSSGTRDLLMYDKTGTYGALPATGDTSASATYTRSAGGQVGVLLK